jgi:peptidase A4-like protein
MRQSDLYANNWSDYAPLATNSLGTTTSAFDSISAHWIVPEVTAASAPVYSSAWIGMGGFSQRGDRLVQAGTEQDVASDGSKNYYAWFEALPRSAVNLGPVSPGDIIDVRINRVGNSQSLWHVTLLRDSKGITDTFIDNDFPIRTNSQSRRSAEFIVEAPAVVSGRTVSRFLPLADFREVSFTNCTTNAGGLGSLTSLYKITMTSDGTKSGTALASATVLKGDAFSVNRLH